MVKRIRKIRVEKNGKPLPPLRKLILLCEEKPEVAQEIFEWISNGKSTREEIRFMIERRFGIKLTFDNRLSQWLSWYSAELDREQGNMISQDSLRWYLENAKNATPEEIRNATLLQLHLREAGRGDTDKQLKVLKEVRQGQTLDLEKEKWKASMRSKLELALEALFKEIEAIPAAVALYKELQELVAAEKQ